jgi:hypothetical protein
VVSQSPEARLKVDLLRERSTGQNIERMNDGAGCCHTAAAITTVVDVGTQAAAEDVHHYRSPTG